MQKRKGSIVLSVILALSMMMTIVSCSGKTTEPQKETAAQSSAAEQTTDAAVEDTDADTQETVVDDIMTPYGRYPETVVMTTAKKSSAQPNFVAGDSVGDSAMTRFIKDKVNVEIQVEWEVESSEFTNKLSLMLASGSLPDMFSLGANDYLLYKQLEENDMLADLQAGYDACAGEHTIKTIGPDSAYGGRNLAPFYNEAGEMLAFASGRYGYEHNQLWLRKDWLDASSLAEPSTLEDVENILKTWKENPPSEDYVGMLINSRSISGVYDSQSASPVFGAFHAYPGAWIKDGNGDVVWGSVTPEAKAGLEVLARWYKEGYIDQEFATRTGAGTTDAMWTSGQSGSIFAPWWFVYSAGEFPNKVPDGEMRPYNAPRDSDGKYNIMFPGAAGDYVMIRKGYEHPEALFKVINCEFDMWFEFDPEAAALVKPNRDNNVDWTYMFPTSNFNIARVDTVPYMGKLAKAYVETGGANGVVPEIPMYVGMAERALEYTKSKENAGTNWIDYYGRYVASNIMDGPEISIVYPSYSFVTESMADLKPNLDTLEQMTFLKIVMGELPLDAFDQFVTDWYAQGGQRMTDEVRELVVD